MTLNQTLQKVYKEQIKVSLLIGDVGDEYVDVIIKHIGRSDITFINTIQTKDKTLLVEYVINKRLITGIGYTIAAIEKQTDNNDDDIDWVEII